VRPDAGPPLGIGCRRSGSKQETPQSMTMTNRATRLEVSQGHQTRYHSIGLCYVYYGNLVPKPIRVFQLFNNKKCRDL